MVRAVHADSPHGPERAGLGPDVQSGQASWGAGQAPIDVPGSARGGIICPRRSACRLDPGLAYRAVHRGGRRLLPLHHAHSIGPAVSAVLTDPGCTLLYEPGRRFGVLLAINRGGSWIEKTLRFAQYGREHSRGDFGLCAIPIIWCGGLFHACSGSQMFGQGSMSHSRLSR